jgi:hypothetical protein
VDGLNVTNADQHALTLQQQQGRGKRDWWA